MSTATDSSVPVKQRIQYVLDLARRLLATPTWSAEANDWMAWTATYLVWHESAHLTTAEQLRGPARGIVQLEPETVWDTLNQYIFRPRRRRIDAIDEPTAGHPVVPVAQRLAYLLEGVPDPTRREAVSKALLELRMQARPGIRWTGGGEVASELVSNDEFAMRFMVLHLRRFRVTFPPLQVSVSQSPQGSVAHGEHLFFWLKRWWKGRARDEAERSTSFLASARELDDAWTGAPAPSPLRPAGAAWVSEFPTSTSLDDLDGGTDETGFKHRFTRFYTMLKERLPAGSAVTINATLRPRQRAYLMHWSFRIAREGVPPSAVPRDRDVQIDWGNGGNLTPKQAAEEMVVAYGITAKIAPSLKSRHCIGRAVDMDVKWNTDFTAQDGSGKDMEITGGPRSALHPQLIAVARTFGVEHFYIPEKDPSHWSDNGH